MVRASYRALPSYYRTRPDATSATQRETAVAAVQHTRALGPKQEEEGSKLAYNIATQYTKAQTLELMPI